MTFTEAGARMIASLETGMYEAAQTLMRRSVELCPVSGPFTYTEQHGTPWRTIGGKRVKFDLADDDAFIQGDQGTLRRSARVFPPRRDGDGSTVEVGYGFGEELNPAGRHPSAYAIPVHEMAEYSHRPPTQSHYLQDPLLAFAGQYEAALVVAAREGRITPTPELTGTELGADAA